MAMHSKNLTTSVQALFRVFVLPALSRPTGHVYRPSIPSATSHQCPPTQALRSFSQASPRLAGPRRSRPTRTQEPRKQVWDHEITSRYIWLVDEETGRLYEDTRNTRNLLESLDLKTYRLVQVTEGNPNSEDPVERLPVCKVINKKEDFIRQKQRKEQTKEQRKVSKVVGDQGAKVVELNWAIDANDLSHRMEKVKGFLAEGRKVEIVLNAKKRGRKASAEECEALLDKIKETVAEVKGASIKGGLEGVMGKFAQMDLRGAPVDLSQKGQKAAAGDGAASGDSKAEEGAKVAQ